MLSSSFGTTAVFQLHLFYKQQTIQPVHFIDTTFHLSETLAYKDILKKLFDLEVIDNRPDTEWIQLSHESELWRIDPDRCCRINKVQPFEKVKENYDRWISGRMRWQSSHREKLNIFEQRKGIIKFYPILDVMERGALEYIENINFLHILQNLLFKNPPDVPIALSKAKNERTDG